VSAPDVTVSCEWFAKCTHAAHGVVWHSVLGYVSTCRDCAELLGLALIPARFEVWDDETRVVRAFTVVGSELLDPLSQPSVAR
jgi:hypothetical protein